MQHPCHFNRIINQQEVYLSTNEFEVLYMLYSSPQTTFTKKEIYEKIWNEPTYSHLHAVENTIFQIRKRQNHIARDKSMITFWVHITLTVPLFYHLIVWGRIMNLPAFRHLHISLQSKLQFHCSPFLSGYRCNLLRFSDWKRLPILL